MYQFDYNYLMLMQKERLREAEKQRRASELLQEARTGKLNEIVHSWQRTDQQKQAKNDARIVPAI